MRLRVLAANIAANDVTAEQVLDRVRRWDVDVFSVARAPAAGRGRLRRRGHPVGPPPPRAAGAAGVRGHRALLAAAAAPAPRPARHRVRPGGGGAAPAGRRAGARSSPSTSSPPPTPRRRRAVAAGAADAAGRGPGPPRCSPATSTRRSTTPACGGLLDRGYRDAAEQAGVGLRPTWPAGRRAPPHARDDRPRAGRPSRARDLGPQRRDPGLRSPRRARGAAAAARMIR